MYCGGFRGSELRIVSDLALVTLVVRSYQQNDLYTFQQGPSIKYGVISQKLTSSTGFDNVAEAMQSH